MEPTQQEQSVSNEITEMSLQEMMFLVSACFYTTAAEIGQQALEAKNEALVVIKHADVPDIAKEIEAAGKEITDFKTKETKYDGTAEPLTPEEP